MRTLFGALALAASLTAVMPALAGEGEIAMEPPTRYIESPSARPSVQYREPRYQPRYEQRYYEPPAPRYRPEYRPEYRTEYPPEPRFAGYGYGRGCNAVKGTFCYVSRPRPIGSNCSCPKDGGVREGYIDR